MTASGLRRGFSVSLICYPYFPSLAAGRGHDRYIYELQRNLKRGCPEANVVAFHQGHARNAREAALKKVAFVLGLLRVRADLYHAMSPVGGAAAVMLGKRPLVVTVHDLLPFDVRDYDHPWKQWYVRSCVRICVRSSTALVVGHESLKRELVLRFGIPPVKVRVVPYGVDHAWYFPRTARARSERDILYVGEVSRAKGVDTLIRAFVAVKKSIPHARLIVGGKWSRDQPGLEALGRDLGLSSDIEFKGFIPEDAMPDCYSAAAVMVFPSRYGFALPPLEAMACGTPVIVGNVFDAPEFIADAGILVNPEDCDEVAREIIRVLTDPSLRMSLAAKGLRRAGEYSWERTARLTGDVYQHVVRGRERDWA